MDNSYRHGLGHKCSRFHLVNTYLLMVTYRVDMTCLFPEHLLQLLGDEVNGKLRSQNGLMVPPNH